MTFQQAGSLAAFVKKGEHGSPVVYASTFKKKDTTEAGDEIEQEIPFLKEYTVFNADQVRRTARVFLRDWPRPCRPSRWPASSRPRRFFANTKADIRTGGNRAYYAIEADYVQMPPFEMFRDTESHAATLAHELTHWTRHPSRLNREFGRKKWGDEGYAMEELVAELGFGVLVCRLAITPEVREDHASYIDSWLKVLKDDKRAVFSAASHAIESR